MGELSEVKNPYIAVLAFLVYLGELLLQFDGSDVRYCQQLAHHMELVGSRGVRDVGTIGGNLMLRHQVAAVG